MDRANDSRLNLVILRLGLVYGKYDTKQVAKSLVLGRVYKSLDEELRWLWTKDTKINTVHVTDAARSAWAAASWLSTTSSKPATTPIFNVVDHTNTSQGHLAALITSAVGVQTSFVGSILSTFAKLNMDNVLEDINEAVMGPWAELLDKEGMRTGPLNPFMEKEQVKDEDLCLDGALFETTVGFEYERERFEQDGLEEMITSYKEMGWWP